MGRLARALPWAAALILALAILACGDTFITLTAPDLSNTGNNTQANTNQNEQPTPTPTPTPPPD